MSHGRIAELRFQRPGYLFDGKLQVGSSMEDALSTFGPFGPATETVTGGKRQFEDRVLYTDMDGRAGYRYYARPPRFRERSFACWVFLAFA